jgi:co-chaperonin GroES (HSP10)
MQNLTLLGEKIAVTQAKEQLQGSIILPENRMIKFEIGKVINIGDGKYRDGTERKMWVKPGDLVMYQLGGPQIENSKFKLRGNPIKVFHQGDVIAKLDPMPDKPDTVIVSMDTFHIIGNWVLLEVVLEQGVIIVPEKVAPSEDFKFKLVQKGEGVEIPVEKGDMVYPERGKCLPVEIEHTTYVYTHQDYLHGVLKDTEIKFIDKEVEDSVPTPSEAAAATT